MYLECCVKCCKIKVYLNVLYKLTEDDPAEVTFTQGIGIKGKEMALVRQEKASRTAFQPSSLLHTHTLLVQTHNMTTVKEIAEQCCQL